MRKPSKKTTETATTTASKSLTLRYPPRPPDITEDVAKATLAVEGLAHNAVTTVQYSDSPMSELGLTECLEALKATAATVQRGSLQDVEALLVGQAVALNAIFTNLALRAKWNLGHHLDATDRYLRLALKAQGQCRATLETLGTIKNPTVFARQANIAHGPQQINNGAALARAANSETEPNKLLEAHGERLDAGTTHEAGSRDPELATVGALHRSANN